MADASAIADIHVASWRDAYASLLDPEYLAGPIEDDRLALWTHRCLQGPANQLIQVAETRGGPIAGFICSYRDHDEHWGSWIDNLHVLPSMRGRRIGELLLSPTIQNLARATGRGVYLWVFEANGPALRFYQRLGGEVVERDSSRLPAAGGKAILRVYWPDAETIRRQAS